MTKNNNSRQLASQKSEKLLKELTDLELENIRGGAIGAINCILVKKGDRYVEKCFPVPG